MTNSHDILKKKMSKPQNTSEPENHRLEVRKQINASPEKVFETWTQPEHIRKWWGPEDVICLGAQVDLQIGGKYQISNRLPNGKELLIYGEFLIVEPPSKLVFTWRTDPGPNDVEMVTVRFSPRNGGTEVIVVHEKIPTKEIRASHNAGWTGCLEGLESYFKHL